MRKYLVIVKEHLVAIECYKITIKKHHVVKRKNLLIVREYVFIVRKRTVSYEAFPSLLIETIFASYYTVWTLLILENSVKKKRSLFMKK